MCLRSNSKRDTNVAFISSHRNDASLIRHSIPFSFILNISLPLQRGVDYGFKPNKAHLSHR
jgi:hypothetical protein